MNARRLALVAAALGFTASQYALWLQMRDTLHALAEVERRVGEHRCPVVPAAVPVLGEGIHSMTPPPLTGWLPTMTDPALKDRHA